MVFIASCDSVFALCPAQCECPLEVPKCAPGVGLVLDSCNCCKVCAKQLNEDCSQNEPCDHTKGLECNFGASSGATRGICRVTCIDGAVGCIPLCPQELSLPTLGCANPRLVKVPGQCCEKWVCDDAMKLEPSDKLLDKDTLLDETERDLTSRNELVADVRHGPKSLPAFRAQAESHMFSEQKCILQTTPWSPCSKSCGTGISSRVTNKNPECKLVKESRICEIRPCTQSPYSSLKKGKKCNRTKKSIQAVKFTYAGCSSLKKYRPKYCGSCVDGRCCSPQQTRTVRVKFRCEDGETFNKNVMLIETCKCSFNCPHANEASYPFSGSLMTSTNSQTEKEIPCQNDPTSAAMLVMANHSRAGMWVLPCSANQLPSQDSHGIKDLLNEEFDKVHCSLRPYQRFLCLLHTGAVIQ
ncbi:Protein CYR61 [Bagarius yarrelli]|uniref:CCN family member 1 n=1 Tax=Bagarius yarrelli TaxID=175774 RepID=A0A556VBM7_BAGYA|nr:Protein CYR61 [Bagarius yarrelli]